VEELENLVSILGRVIDGSMTPENAIKHWPHFSPGKLKQTADVAYHRLQHFYIDTDIQQKDPSYKRAQILGLKESLEDARKLI
jgi:hypothetical protein